MLRVVPRFRPGTRGVKLPAFLSSKKSKKEPTYNQRQRERLGALADSIEKQYPDAPNPIKMNVQKETTTQHGVNPVSKQFYDVNFKRFIKEDGSLLPPTFQNRRKVSKLFKRDPEPREVSYAPRPTPTHLVNYVGMCQYIEDLGDRWRYPEEWEDYMEYAIENGVGLTPEKPHIIYSESARAITSCICDPEMPMVNYHYLDVNDGEPMCCQCGYYFRLEQMLVAPPMHQLMAIPDGGWFDPRLYSPDDHTYKQHPREVKRLQDNPPVKDLLAGLDLPKDSGLNVLDMARVRYLQSQAMEADPDAPRFSIDYRQKPKGIKNYTMMEQRLISGDDENETYEDLLLPEDEEEAHLYLKGTPKPQLSADETKKLE